MAWMDAARGFSVLAVVLLHVAGSVVAQTPIGSLDWWFGNLYASMVRWCVPVFVMVSGALLLDPAKREGIAAFYRKRLARIFIPLCFWTVVYVAWNHRAAIGALRVADFREAIARGWPHYHLWFMFMIVCLYIFVPYLRPVVWHTRRRDLWWLVGILFLFAGINEFNRVFTGNQAGLFINWFLQYLPYFLCGHLINTSTRLPHPFASACTFAATVFLTAMGCYWLGLSEGIDKGLYFYGYLSPFVIPMSVSAMLLFKAWTPPTSDDRFIGALAALSMGIYLVHPILLETIREYVVKPESHQAFATVPLITVAVCAGSLAFAWIVHRIPALNRVI